MDSDVLNKKIVQGSRQCGVDVHINQNGKAEIKFLDNAGSLSPHYAMAYVFLSDLMTVAENSANLSMAVRQQVNNDLKTLREFAEAQRHKLPVSAGDQEWQPVPISGILTNEQLKTLYEVTAIAYIKYLIQSEAPSRKLENVFSSIKNSLQGESDSLPDITLNSEIIHVFDRLLATDAEIQSKKAVQPPKNRPAHDPFFSQSSALSTIPAEILNRATTITKRVGLLCLSVGIAFLLLGLVTWSRYDLYDPEEFHGIMMLLGTILVPAGVFFYSGIADRLFYWIKTGK